jgi:hypothetical protein
MSGFKARHARTPEVKANRKLGNREHPSTSDWFPIEVWREKYLHLLSRATEKLPESPELPDSKAWVAGNSGNLGNFLVDAGSENRNFLALPDESDPKEAIDVLRRLKDVA